MDSSPSTSMIDREKMLLQINANLDKRFESFAKASRTPTPAASFPLTRIMPHNTIASVKIAQPIESNVAHGILPNADRCANAKDTIHSGNESGMNVSTKPAPAPIHNRKSPAGNPKANGLDEITRRNLSTDATLKFLKSKVCILHQELEKSRAEESNKSRLFSEQQEECKKAISNAERFAAQNAALNCQLEKMEKSLEAARESLKTKNEHLDATKRTLEERSQELTKLTQLNVNLERRLSKAADDLEQARQSAAAARAAEQDVVRMHTADKRHAESQLKTLSDQRAGLIAAFKKQLYLLDNLKRQNACLEQAKLLAFVESDFVRMLDTNRQSS